MNIIYVDDESAAIETFISIISDIEGVSSVNTFKDPYDAINFVSNSYNNERVNIAFLDIEMPEMKGIDLANFLRKIDKTIRIIFITAYNNFASEAFDTGAIGYLLKPYNAERLQNEIEKAKPNQFSNITKSVYIKTMPSFDIFVDGKLFSIRNGKQKELLALLVDRQGEPVSPGQVISYMWEDKSNDEKTGTLYRMTYKRLRKSLAGVGIDYLIGSNSSGKYINMGTFESDYNAIMSGNSQAIYKYTGEYMSQYSWAESTNAQIALFVSKKLNK